MKSTTRLAAYCAVLLSAAAIAAMRAERSAASRTARPSEFGVVEKWRGSWEVKATRRHPAPVQTVTYVETFDWILDGRYLRSETSRKSDSSQSMTMFWFDLLTKTYRYVIFDI